MSANALFVVIGGDPKTGWLPDEVERDAQGYVITGRDLETSMPGVFAAGDVRHGSLKRVASAVGEGATVVRMVHEYLAETQDERAYEPLNASITALTPSSPLKAGGQSSVRS